jgi:cystathionine beta-lyase/cystathionine gamma-synthase
VFTWLKQHEQVEKIYFPFDPDFAQYELAKQQMSGACGLLSFVIKASSVDEIEKFCEGLQHIIMAVSWGGHESLVIPKCAGMPKEDFGAAKQEHRMIRLYVGQEDAEYIIKDLERGFEKMKGNV